MQFFTLLFTFYFLDFFCFGNFVNFYFLDVFGFFDNKHKKLSSKNFEPVTNLRISRQSTRPTVYIPLRYWNGVLGVSADLGPCVP